MCDAFGLACRDGGQAIHSVERGVLLTLATDNIDFGNAVSEHELEDHEGQFKRVDFIKAVRKSFCWPKEGLQRSWSRTSSSNT